APLEGLIVDVLGALEDGIDGLLSLLWIGIVEEHANLVRRGKRADDAHEEAAQKLSIGRERRWLEPELRPFARHDLVDEARRLVGKRPWELAIGNDHAHDGRAPLVAN